MTAAISEAQAARPLPSPARAWSALSILWFIYVMSNVDRNVISVLIEPIKAELRLSDLQMGVLTGFAFSFFFAIFSVPVARLADRGYRHRVIWLCLLLWSAMSAACGLAQSFAQLVLARFGVGAAEGGVAPSLQSMTSDLFPPARRNTAIAVLQSGGTVGILVALVAGSYFNGLVGWRMTFVIVSLPGVIAVLLFLLVVPDVQPPRVTTSKRNAGTFSALLRSRYFVPLCLSCGLQIIIAVGIPVWFPAFLERSHGIGRGQIGMMVAGTSSLGQLAGVLLGGPLADRLARRSVLWPARLILGVGCASFVPAAAIFLFDDLRYVLIAMTLTGFLSGMPSALLVAMMQETLPPAQRAVGAAGLLLTSVLLGAGIAPVVVGLLSDLYAQSLGPDALRYALLTVVAVVAPLAGLVFTRVLMLRVRDQAPAA